jgi:hypothetical protein
MLKLKIVGAGCAALLSMLVLASAASAVPATPGVFVIPAGYTATLSGGTFCADDSLTYGYTLNGGSLQPLASGGNGEQCGTAAGGTVGPFNTQRTVRVYLTDNYCALTYYSDGTGAGDHSLVTPEGTNTWGVSITDCGIGGDTTDTRIPSANGDGNLNVTVTISPATGGNVCEETAVLATGSPFSNTDVVGACLAIDEVFGPPSSRNAAAIRSYDIYVGDLVAAHWLSSANAAYLESAAAALN